MNTLTSAAKTLFAILAAFPLLLGFAVAQEQESPVLDPEMPWFKVEVIVFRDLREIPDDEVFTPPPGATVSGFASGNQTGVIDARALGQDVGPGGDGDSQVQENEFPTGDAAPEFGDTVDDPLSEAGIQDEADTAYFERGSRFRLVAIENLFPEPGPESAVASDSPPSELPETVEVNPKAGLSPEMAADYALLNELQLSGESTRIARSRNYQLLAHMAWIQPGYPLADAMPFPLAELAGPRSGLSGDLTLHLSRYLHLGVNLAFDETQLQDEGESADPVEALIPFPGAMVDGQQSLKPEYRLIERRRMRSGELHYIDHPKFGVLVRISKVGLELLDPAGQESGRLRKEPEL